MNLKQLNSEGDLNLSPERQKWSERPVDNTTRDLLEQDARYFLHQSLSTPCLDAIEAAEGPYLITVSGKRILDFHGNGVHQLGFGHPAAVSAVKEQLEQLSFCTRRYTNAPAVQLARKLTELAPGDLSRVLFAPGGSTAMGMALKLARVATGKHKTISLWDSFHGASLDTISIGGEAIFRAGAGPLLPGSEHAPPPYPPGCPFKCGSTCSLQCAEYIEYMLEKEGGDVAAVVAETIRSIPYIPPPDYWKKVRAACDKHGALLILDEIPTGIGRSGKFYVFEHYGIVPDMVVLGKGLGGGIFPLAALIARENLNLAPEKALGHYTHEKNPVACAAGLAVVEIVSESSFLEDVNIKGEFFKQLLLDLGRKHQEVVQVRQLGLIVGFDILFKDKSRSDQLTEKLMYEALSRGLNFKITMGNVVSLSPPLIISKEELRKSVEILEESLVKVKLGMD